YEHIRIEVEDNGYGMTPEYLETIFDAFTRAENSTTNKVQGTGLGMAITKSIVELMGGTIEVFSEVGRGSLFRVDLELRILEEPADRQFWELRGISHILTVVGNPDIRENILSLMQDTRVTLDIAASPEEALARLHSGGSCQLALLDWDDCGFQAVQALREALTDAVPIVLLTEFDTVEIEEALQFGRMAVITKPFFVSALQRAVEGLWEQPSTAVGPEPQAAEALNGLRFLAAEDNEINAEILAELLEIEGAACEIVANGLLAVERFQCSEPGWFDAILMDVQMPVMNGHDASRAIRALEREDAARIPIIAMTANAFAEDEKAALDAGMDAHVPKPLDMELLKKVMKQLNRSYKEPLL
ncbi:MAG: response regulator, partial [Eubacteriales bacterium]|nr:response regulator [Eubacteriales bacterium]